MANRYMVEEVASATWFVRGPHSNWTFTLGSHGLILFDTGSPKDRNRLRSSIRDAGFFVEDIAGIMLTHSHADHMGNAEAIAREARCFVYCSEHELPHVDGNALYRPDHGPLLRQVWRPRVAWWAAGQLDSLRHGASPVSRARTIPSHTTSDDSLGLDVIALRTPGHTSGHTAFWLPERSTLVAGDVLTTGHPLKGGSTPSLMPDFLQADPDRAARSLQRLGVVRPDVILPGHGPGITHPDSEVFSSAAQRPDDTRSHFFRRGFLSAR
jgi:glyoxylase-like metal-dependent hydrolase (beta-lactamase superfamily II)